MVLSWVIGTSATLRAGELAGVTLPESVVVAGESRLLNGLGLRLATFFKVKVYVAGLYVTEKSSDAAKLLADSSSKLVRLFFLRDVDAETLRDAFADGFEKSCRPEECQRLAASVKSFVALQSDVKKGGTLDFELLPAEIVVKKDGKETGRIAAPGLGQVILRIWIGENPPNAELKAGLLGTP